MAVYDGVYKSPLQGVSQQTPQERSDGQLSEQINMLSDPVTGLRRRSGVRYVDYLVTVKPHWYLEVIEYQNSLILLVVDIDDGNLYLYEGLTDNQIYYATGIPYLKALNGKKSIKTAILNNEVYILNTEKIPTTRTGGFISKKNPSKYGYYSIRSTAFQRYYELVITYDSQFYSAGWTTGNTAAGATPESIAQGLITALNTNHPTLVNNLTLTRAGNTVAVEVKDKTSTGILEVTSSTNSTYMTTSGISRVASRTELLGTLPSVLDDYVIAVGTTGNSAYYQYSSDTKLWTECGGYDERTGYNDLPYTVILDTDPMKILVYPMQLKSREAGDDENNPYPKFIDYGITGISAYQSRLVLLSGAYVHLSKSRDYEHFMRTTVTELLDDDAIEVSSSALTAAQFEYAIPYNRDLVLISQNQQAVIPANSTVLTPKTAVIYPSTELDISLASKPTVVGRTLYYTYQRGAEYYQAGEFVPNTYTEGQYYAQNLTDHLPLYARGVCNGITASSTNNTVVFTSDSQEVLVNQFLWVGEERPMLAFHKWVFPYKVVYAKFIEEYLVVLMDTGNGSVYSGTLNLQFNQLDDKPVPYLDMYRYVEIDETGQGDLRQVMSMDSAIIYDSGTSRHKEVAFEQSVDYIFNCPYVGTVVVGLNYESTFTLTPPFMKDNQGAVITSTRTTLQSLRMTYKNTGSFLVNVSDTMGEAYSGERTALTWSEADLDYTWVNSIGAVNIPCRTRLTSTECTVSTSSTTDMNLISTEYTIRTAAKRRRL